MLFVKMLQDIKKNIISFIAIFCMALISVMIYAGLSVVDTENIDKYISESNFRDLEVRGDIFTESDIEKLKDIKGIVDAEGYLNSSGKLILEDEVKVLISYISGNNISKLHVAEGEPYTKGASGVWLEKTMCDAKGIKVGDKCEIVTGDTSICQEVKGLVYSPQYMYYIVDSTFTETTYTEYGFAIMDDSQIPGGIKVYDQILVDTELDSAKVELSENDDLFLSDIKENIKDKLENDVLIITNREQDFGVKSYRADLKSAGTLGIVFPLIFGIVAVLGIVSTMSRLITKQRTVIGTLKALGYTNIQILFHYMSYVVFIVIFGGILGAIIGYRTIGTLMLQTATDLYLNPYERKHFTPLIFAVILILVGTAMLVTYVCIRKILAQSTASILRPQAPSEIKNGWYENLKWWKKIRFATQWNIRDVTTNSIRTIVSIVAVIACSALIFSAVYYMKCFEYQPKWSYNTLIDAEYRIEFSDSADYDTISDYAKEYDGQMIEQRYVRIHTDDELTGYYLTVVDEGDKYLLNDNSGEYLSIPENSVAISDKTSKITNISVGGTIEFNLYGEKKTYKDSVDAIYKIPYSQGITMTREHYEKLGGTFRPNFLYTGKAVPKSLEEASEVISVVSVEALRQGVENAIESNYITVITIAVLAIILGAVMLLNMGSLSYREKVRDMAVLKVLGFSTIDLKKLLMQQNFYITLFGWFIGIFFGFPILDMLLSVSGEIVDFMVLPSIIPYFVDFCATFGLSVIINIYIISGIDNIDMVEELKET